MVRICGTNTNEKIIHQSSNELYVIYSSAVTSLSVLQAKNICNVPLLYVFVSCLVIVRYFLLNVTANSIYTFACVFDIYMYHNFWFELYHVLSKLPHFVHTVLCWDLLLLKSYFRFRHLYSVAGETATISILTWQKKRLTFYIVGKINKLFGLAPGGHN